MERTPQGARARNRSARHSPRRAAPAGSSGRRPRSGACAARFGTTLVHFVERARPIEPVMTASCVPAMNSAGCMIFAPSPRRGQLPVAVDVAIPVESAAEAGAGDIRPRTRRGRPRSARAAAARRRAARREIPSRGPHTGSSCLRAAYRPSRCRGCARSVKRGSRANSSSARLLLEIEIVVVGLSRLAQRVERRQRAAPAVRHAHARRPRERDPAASAPQCQATGAPQSWPTISARFSPSAATSATMSPTVCRIV